jgi:hypothetical protein
MNQQESDRSEARRSHGHLQRNWVALGRPE